MHVHYSVIINCCNNACTNTSTSAGTNASTSLDQVPNAQNIKASIQVTIPPAQSQVSNDVDLNVPSLVNPPSKSTKTDVAHKSP